ncbi:MAG: D-alanyl-D-alanine carboxypeptidase, partial [Myxococcota bacterium]
MAGCGAAQTKATRPLAPPHPAEQLRRALSPLGQAGASVGVLVVDDATGEVLLADRAAEVMTPGSVQKVLTTSALLRYLPPDLRFVTTVAGPAPNAEGTVEGDLWLVGDGDPGFGSLRGLPDAPPGQPGLSPTLERMAEALKAHGIKR